MLFCSHGLGFAALRLTGPPFQRARLLTGGQASSHSFAFTSVVMAGCPAGRGPAAPDRTRLRRYGPRLLLPSS
ncbi:hypothetical protein NKH77_04110 [Streptomyces sp. M19]